MNLNYSISLRRSLPSTHNIVLRCYEARRDLSLSEKIPVDRLQYVLYLEEGKEDICEFLFHSCLILNNQLTYAQDKHFLQLEVYAYENSQARFVKDFVKAWSKVMKLDRFDLKHNNT